MRTLGYVTAPSTKLHRAHAVIALAAGCLVLASCGQSGDSTEASASKTSSNQAEATASATASETSGASVDPVKPALSVKDSQGTEITLEKIPEKVVCLTGACDDMLFSLGLKPAATSTNGLLTLPEYWGPEEGKKITEVPGTFGNEDVEVVAAQKPDLVIGLAGVHEALRPAVEKHAPLWTMKIGSHDDSITNLRALAALTNKPEPAAKAEQAFNDALATAKSVSKENNLKDKTALVMYSSGAGRGVNTDEGLLGGLAGEIYNYPWPNKGGGFETAQKYSTEEILAKNPDVVFIQSFTAGNAKKGSEELASDPAWKRVKAVQDDAVHEVNTPLWTTGRGPHALTMVLKELTEKAPK